VGQTRDFLEKLAEATGTIMIPGTRNHFDPHITFNFRINLARSSPQFYSALTRCIRYLSTLS
jgi:hypothetical protein